jgi:hypothetical protein
VGIVKNKLAYWHMAVIPAFKGMRQEDGKFEANLSYIVRPCLYQEQQLKTKIKLCPQSFIISLWLKKTFF